MKKVLLPLLVSLSFFTGVAFASNDCNDPIDTWQPKVNLQEALKSKGWLVDRVRIDDGCYEVKGIDILGNHFEALFEPSSLKIRKLEIEFGEQGSLDDYLNKK